jgi:hypothetical protein
MNLGTRRDPSAFEYLPSSSAPAVLSHRRSKKTQSAASILVAEQLIQISNDKDGQDDNDSDEFFNSNEFDTPKLRQLTTTQLRLQRLKGLLDTYLPSTLPPRLHQTNPFLHQTELDGDAGEIQYEITAAEKPATAQEIQSMADEEADEEALSQAVETMQTSVTRASRKRTATTKVVENARQAKVAKRGGRGGQCSGGKV